MPNGECDGKGTPPGIGKGGKGGGKIMGTPSGKGKGGKGEGITIKKSWQRLNAEKLSQTSERTK